MKLVIQIPCYNEEETLPATVGDFPTELPGIDVIELLVIDDGSSDRTVEVARSLGVHHILSNRRNVGLARTFQRGLDHALSIGADILVNTDGDNQYAGQDIGKLIEPIVAGRADLVVGDRQTSTVAHFSFGKKLLQKFGSAVVRRFSGVDVPDAVSGFRAISRSAMSQINIVSTFSYTIEMLIQVGRKGISFESVPIGTNFKTRESRLFKSISHFIRQSGGTTLRMYAMYSPLKTFTVIGLFIMLIGIIPMARFLYYYLFISGEGKIQSLIVGAALLTSGTVTFVVGLLADLLSRNRQLLEVTLERVKRIEYALQASEDRALATRGKQPSVAKKLENARNGQNQE